MYPAVKKVKSVEDYKLLLTFSNGEKRLFNMKPYLNKGIFKQLKDVALFNTVRVSFDTVEWDNEADFDPEVLYTQSKKITAKNYPIGKSLISSAAEKRVKYSKK
jgi:hypothetical protein